MDGSVDLLHREVRAFHDAHLDRRATLGAALRGPFGQPLERVEGVHGPRRLEVVLIEPEPETDTEPFEQEKTS